MTRQNISIGSSANDGTGDTLRSAGTKINANFTEIYNFLGTAGDSSSLASRVKFQDSAVVFEGSNLDAHETRLFVAEPTGDRVVTIPDATGNVVLDTTTQTLTNKSLTAPILTGSSASAGSILFKEDTDNGTNAVTLIGPAATADVTVTLPASTDTLVGKATTDTLTNKTLTSPKIGTAINDTNGNEVIKLTATGSAVNELTVANGASTTGPTLSATGGGANLNIIMTPKGTGSVELNKAAFSSSTITANGAASTAATFIIGNKGSQLDVSLADGTTVGEYKIFTNKGAGAMHVTPTNFAQGTKFVLAQYDGCTCVWDGANWYLIGNQGELTVS